MLFKRLLDHSGKMSWKEYKLMWRRRTQRLRNCCIRRSVSFIIVAMRVLTLPLFRYIAYRSSLLTLPTKIHTGIPLFLSMMLYSGAPLFSLTSCTLIRSEIFVSSWDTFRTVHPMLSLIAPREWADIVNAYVDGWRHTGS